jgi:hypothetical protein
MGSERTDHQAQQFFRIHCCSPGNCITQLYEPAASVLPLGMAKAAAAIGRYRSEVFRRFGFLALLRGDAFETRVFKQNSGL